MITCQACRKKTDRYGEGNLDKILTPSLQGHVLLCPSCWEVCVSQATGLVAWEKLMKGFMLESAQFKGA